MNVTDAINIAKQGKPVTRMIWQGTREMVCAGNRMVYLELDGERKWLKACLLDSYDIMANDWILAHDRSAYEKIKLKELLKSGQRSCGE